MHVSIKLLVIFLFSLLITASAHGAEEKGRAYYDFGVFAYEDGDYEDALKNLQQALQASPANPFYQHFLGKILFKMERHQEAMVQLDAAFKADPKISGLRFDLASLYSKMGDYSKAAPLFMKVAASEPANVMAQYHAGISNLKLERYERALPFFIKAAEASSTLKANGYYYAGICYLNLAEFDKAADRFAYVRDNADSAVLKENAGKWLQVVAKRQKSARRYSLFFRLGRQYDDNVLLEPLDDQDLFADEADWVTTAAFSGWYFFMGQQKYSLDVGYSHYQTDYDQLDEYNLVSGTLSVAFKCSLPPYTLGFAYRPSLYRIDSENYMIRQQFQPEVSRKWGDNILSRLSYSYFVNNHFQSKNRDGHTNDLSLDGYYYLLDKGWQIFAGLGYENHSASHPDNYYYLLKAKLGISVPVVWDMSFSAICKYSDREHDYVDSVSLVTREDRKWQGTVSLSRRFIYDWLNITGEFQYIKNNSNFLGFEYKRTTGTIFLAATY